MDVVLLPLWHCQHVSLLSLRCTSGSILFCADLFQGSLLV